MNINSFFESYLKKDSIFKNKNVLTSSYVPETLVHRSKEIEIISSILAPSLKKDSVSNLFIYGKTGTGKTVTIKYIASQMIDVTKKHDIPLEIIYVNCKLNKIADTEYRLLSHLLNFFGEKVPSTGLPTQSLYHSFFSILDKKKGNVILILDEIDQLVEKSGDELIYIFLRKNEELKNAHLSIVGLSNNVGFTNSLDPRIKSSLSQEEINFDAYNAVHLADILRSRSKIAFKENSLDDGVIEKCAAYAAKEHGDARRAIDLLRVAGELADRNNKASVSIGDLDVAEEKIDKDKFFEMVKFLPKQIQCVLYAIIKALEEKKDVMTGEVYNIYLKMCKNVQLRPLTQRRISDIIVELDLQGLINVAVISNGRYGRTRKINLGFSESIEKSIKSLLEKEFGF